MHEESFWINSLSSVNIILSSISTILKSSGHFSTPNIEPKSDEECCCQSHAVKIKQYLITKLITKISSTIPTHKDAGDNIHKSTEKAAVLVLVEEHTVPVDLGGGDDEHDDPDKDGEVAVGLAGPVHHELAVLLPPLPGGEQKTVTL